MSFGASQKEISFSPFSSGIKEINNNYIFHHKTWHILYFYNKLDIMSSTPKFKAPYLDISSPSYDFTNFSTIFHFLERKRNQIQKKLNEPELNRLAKALGPLGQQAHPVARIRKQRKGAR
jgi:hypothetical protein